MSNTNNPNNPNNKKERRKMIYSDVAPIGLEDYQEYRLHDLYTEKISRPPYDFSENCRRGDSYSSDLLSCHHKDNVLADNFFSRPNIQIIQNGLRAGVYKETKQVISEQDTTQILLTMRYVYFSFAKHLPHNIKGQIKELNDRVLKYLIPLVVSEIKQYTKYIQDSYVTMQPQNYPDQTTSHGQRQYSFFQGF